MNIKSKIRLTIYSLLIMSSFGCQEKRQSLGNSQKPISMNDDTMIQKVLKKQLQEGAGKSIDEAGAELTKIPFEIEELEVSAETAKKILLSNGFKELSDNEFGNKIKNIFGRIVDPNSGNPFLYVNYFDKCDRSFVAYSNNSVDYEGGYIDKQRRLFTDFYYLPEILDYQKEYPTLNNLESSKIIRKSSSQVDVEIPHWKDVANLKEQRKANIQRIIARNMYLFNDNKTYIIWLVTHDKNFIKLLVKNFGYDIEPKFNEMLINEYIQSKDMFKIGELIFAKNCDKELDIRDGMLQSLVTFYQKSSNPHDLFGLMEFSSKLLETDEYNNYSEKEKIKMIAYLADTYDFLFKKNHRHQDGWDPRWNILGAYFEDDSRSKIKWPQLKEEMQKNNYYNLPNLKEVISYAEGFDSVGAPD
ncbi:hypothetical protein FW781_06445 (plasmid) [Chryseobacterium panacisoli]|uniref:Uncharacterized protein n=1 Tax=Chryseobacterium panacisoli TaxID=1807141 RepID=A0A5D8ZZI8_9FLAO|nr:hypothetical protein [Chryseobacterium panacisoli]TZF99562.1 hypothetical protein FW781_06445 [Chryseobacterium panacisoli]